MEKVIDITAKRNGFRRAGMVHSEQTQTYLLSQFTDEQLKQLQEEPMLVVAIRNKDDDSGQQPGSSDELRQKITQLEGDVQILVSQEADARNQVTALTAELDGERQKNAELVSELATAREQLAALTSELDAERHKVADLQVQLDAAPKKGK